MIKTTGIATFNKVIVSLILFASALCAQESSGVRQLSLIDHYWGTAYHVALNGDYADVTCGNWGLKILDISDPTQPEEIGHFGNLGYAGTVIIEGDYAYVEDNNGGLRIVDISDPTQPFLTGLYLTNGRSDGIAIQGNYSISQK